MDELELGDRAIWKTHGVDREMDDAAVVHTSPREPAEPLASSVLVAHSSLCTECTVTGPTPQRFQRADHLVGGSGHHHRGMIGADVAARCRSGFFARHATNPVPVGTVVIIWEIVHDQLRDTRSDLAGRFQPQGKTPTT